VKARVLVIGAIVAAGIYLLSPLTVWFAVVMIPVVALAVRGLPAGERRFVIAITTVAIALRLLVIAALFVATDHARAPFGTFFGDEDYYIRRSLWLRNVAYGISIHPFDLEYAFEQNGRSAFLYVLAFVHSVAGPSPYGVRLPNVAIYVAAVLLMYRAVRVRFGRAAALFGLGILLFLPTLFVWSLSVLKEPLIILLSGASLVLARELVAPAPWWRRALTAATIVALAAALQAVRDGGAVFIAAATIGGLALGFVASRPRLLIAAVVALPILIGAVLRVPEVQLKTYAAVQRAARQHWGAVVVSRGYGYKLLDDRFYADLNSISSLEFAETMRFLARGVVSYVALPRPWDVQSRAAAAYIPEQVVWYVLALLAGVGALLACRRDPLIAGLLVAHAVLISAASAFTDGNIGTLVRHRGLVLPYIVWLSGVGACESIAWLHGRLSSVAPSPLTPDLGAMSTLNQYRTRARGWRMAGAHRRAVRVVDPRTTGARAPVGARSM